MHASDLIALGFDICAGQVDYQGKNYGLLSATGHAILEPDGEALIARLKSKETAEDAVEVPKPARKTPAKKTASAPAQTPAEDDDGAASLAAELKGLTGE